MTQPLLDNVVQLREGVPKRLHFTDHAIADVEIQDPLLQRPKMVTRLTFTVDEEDGSPVAKTFSVLSERLAGDLGPYLPERAYRSLEFVITRRGTGFATSYTVLRIPRSP
jgi:hypothetical protein